VASTYEPIASQTLGSATASVTFSGISASWTDLVVVYNGTVSTLRSLLWRFNSDTATNYSTTELAAYSSTVGSNRDTNDTAIRGTGLYAGMSTSVPSVAVLHVMSYANTNVFKTTLEAGGCQSTEVNRHVGLWRSTSAITSITALLNGSGNFSSGATFSLYGIKAA
jgi:hypothetical protein